MDDAVDRWVRDARAAGREVPPPGAAAAHSGKLLVRMPRSLHAELVRASDREGTSLNAYIVAALSASVAWRRPGGADQEAGRPAASGLTLALKANLVVLGLAAVVAIALLITAMGVLTRAGLLAALVPRLPARGRGGRSLHPASRQGLERAHRRLRHRRLRVARGQAPGDLAALHRLGRQLPVHDRELAQRRDAADVPPEHVEGPEPARALQPRRDRARGRGQLPGRAHARHRGQRHAGVHAADGRDEQLQQPVRGLQLRGREARPRPLRRDVQAGVEARLPDHARRRRRARSTPR